MIGRSKTDAFFFGAFVRHAKASLEASQHVRSLFSELDAARDLARAVAEAEHVGDRITHETIRKLHETWITPLDRSDIHALISRMDDVLDMTEAVSERVVLFEISVARPHAGEIADLLVTCCEAILRAVELLSSMKNASVILEICVRIGELENAADDIYRKAIAELYRPGNDPLDIMKWRDIYDSLETAIDRCSDVANVLEGVVLEYA